MADGVPRSVADLAIEESAQASLDCLRVLLQRLDLLDDWRAEVTRDLQHQSKLLAKARGVPFLRLEAVRKECGL